MPVRISLASGCQVFDAFPFPISEVTRLGRTLHLWRTTVLAYFETAGALNGPTKVVNGVIRTTRRVARKSRKFENCQR